MHNLKDLRKNLDNFKKKFEHRNVDFDIDNFKKKDFSNRDLIIKKEALEQEMNKPESASNIDLFSEFNRVENELFSKTRRIAPK